MALRIVVLVCCLALSVHGAWALDTAHRGSLFAGGKAAPLFASAATAKPRTTPASAPAASAKGAGDEAPERQPSASLFDGPARGLFAPLPERFSGPLAKVWRGPVARLRDIIALAEAGPMGYDAVQYGARIKPPAPPSEMTLAEILAWITATPGQPHAIGRYQIIPSTLKHLIEKEGLAPTLTYGPALQDRLADVLMTEAGLQVFLAGEMAQDTFMDRLARVWAGLPTASGQSYYHGHAGNRATISRPRFAAEMAQIFPEL